MRRILVVEDEDVLRMTVADILADAGYAVETAANGAEALDRVRREPPDAILLDLLMPVMDGRAFLAAGRSEPAVAGVPIAIMSAAPDAKQTAREYGAALVLPNPFDLDVFLATIEGLVSQPTLAARV